MWLWLFVIVTKPTSIPIQIESLHEEFKNNHKQNKTTALQTSLTEWEMNGKVER